jgi:hypothetical protein
MAGMVTHAGTLAAQEVKHLNPVIEKLAAGKAIIGFQTGDLTLGNARTMSRADADYVYVDMEHTPLDFPGLKIAIGPDAVRQLRHASGHTRPCATC